MLLARIYAYADTSILTLLSKRCGLALGRSWDFLASWKFGRVQVFGGRVRCEAVEADRVEQRQMQSQAKDALARAEDVPSSDMVVDLRQAYELRVSSQVARRHLYSQPTRATLYEKMRILQQRNAARALYNPRQALKLLLRLLPTP